MHLFQLRFTFCCPGSVPKGNLAQRGISGAAEGLDSMMGGNSAQRFVDKAGLGGVKTVKNALAAFLL